MAIRGPRELWDDNAGEVKLYNWRKAKTSVSDFIKTVYSKTTGGIFTDLACRVNNNEMSAVSAKLTSGNLMMDRSYAFQPVHARGKLIIPKNQRKSVISMLLAQAGNCGGNGSFTIYNTFTAGDGEMYPVNQSIKGPYKYCEEGEYRFTYLSRAIWPTELTIGAHMQLDAYNPLRRIYKDRFETLKMVSPGLEKLGYKITIADHKCIKHACAGEIHDLSLEDVIGRIDAAGGQFAIRRTYPESLPRDGIDVRVTGRELEFDAYFGGFRGSNHGRERLGEILTASGVKFCKNITYWEKSGMSVPKSKAITWVKYGIMGVLTPIVLLGYGMGYAGWGAGWCVRKVANTVAVAHRRHKEKEKTKQNMLMAHAEGHDIQMQYGPQCITMFDVKCALKHEKKIRAKKGKSRPIKRNGRLSA